MKIEQHILEIIERGKTEGSVQGFWNNGQCSYLKSSNGALRSTTIDDNTK